jgi:hypothetical protein
MTWRVEGIEWRVESKGSLLSKSRRVFGFFL